ncbi:unnamed protein product [Heterosigma akashiwo]
MQDRANAAEQNDDDVRELLLPPPAAAAPGHQNQQDNSGVAAAAAPTANTDMMEGSDSHTAIAPEMEAIPTTNTESNVGSLVHLQQRQLRTSCDRCLQKKVSM